MSETKKHLLYEKVLPIVNECEFLQLKPEDVAVVAVIREFVKSYQSEQYLQREIKKLNQRKQKMEIEVLEELENQQELLMVLEKISNPEQLKRLRKQAEEFRVISENKEEKEK